MCPLSNKIFHFRQNFFGSFSVERDCLRLMGRFGVTNFLSDRVFGVYPDLWEGPTRVPSTGEVRPSLTVRV